MEKVLRGNIKWTKINQQFCVTLLADRFMTQKGKEIHVKVNYLMMDVKGDLIIIT